MTLAFRPRHEPPRPKDGKLAAIRACDAFAHCGDDELARLGAVTEIVWCQAGAVVGADVDASRWWWMPLAGAVAVVEDGRPLTVLGPGQAAPASGRLTLIALVATTALVADRRRLAALD